MNSNGTNRDEVLNNHRLSEHLSNLGVTLKGSGPKRTATRCAGTQHKKDHWCVSVDLAQQIWHCNDCQTGGSIVDWLSIEQGKSASQIFKELAGNDTPPPDDEPNTPQIEKVYDYTDEHGNLKYQAVRMHPKSFRQRHPDDHGGWIWNMEGVTRVLYRLPEVLKASTVWIAEGEKDCDNLVKLGFTATCNVGGALKWLDAYSEVLNGKHVVVVPDNDEPGRKHATQIIASLTNKALSAKLVPMPEPHKDASDYIATFKTPEEAKAALDALENKAVHALKPLPLFNIQELEEKYTQLVRNVDGVCFDLGRFLPSLGRYVRKLIPGQLAVVLASTGVGKSAILQAMARAASPLRTLFFELELTAEDMFERFVQMEIGCYAGDIEQEYRNLPNPIYQHYKGLSHIVVCPESGLKTDEIENLIERSSLKFGDRPSLVLIDYIGLIQSVSARSRYEAISDSAERLKIIAKRTRTIIIMASQVHRPDDKKGSLEVKLTDGKDSGSIENSAGLVIGAWRPEVDSLVLKILKNTRGRSGHEIHCNFDGSKMQITETKTV